MKKLLATICIFLLLPIVCVSAGCNTSNSNGNWVEIKSIRYYLNRPLNGYHETEEYRLTSFYECEIVTEEVTQEEYDNASNEQKVEISSYGYIASNRQEFISSLKKFRNTPFYNYRYSYSKNIIKNYKLYYVKVKFLDNNCLELSYYDTYNDHDHITMRVMPLSYEITYFEN